MINDYTVAPIMQKVKKNIHSLYNSKLQLIGPAVLSNIFQNPKTHKDWLLKVSLVSGGFGSPLIWSTTGPILHFMGWKKIIYF